MSNLKAPKPPPVNAPDTTRMRDYPYPRINTTGGLNAVEKAIRIIVLAALIGIAVLFIATTLRGSIKPPCFLVDGVVQDFSQASFRNSYVTVERDGNTLIIPLSELERVECK